VVVSYGRLARFVAAALLPLPVLLVAQPTSHIVLQLRWRHQFQFAGYYAAQAKGYFAAEGLNVDLVPLHTDARVIDDLRAGKCDYAVGDGSAVLFRQTGERVVIVVPILQSSPVALITRADDHIDAPALLKGKRIILGTLADSAPLQAMLYDAGLKPGDVTILPHSHRLEDLFEGKADAISAYITDEPFRFAQRHQSIKVLWPVNYGIDFYGDLLLTSETEVKRRLWRAVAMRRATLRGWQYALDHPDELIQLIQSRYNSSLSTEELRFEANETRKLIRPDYVELGHLSTHRLQRMAEIFVSEGVAPVSATIKGLTLDDYLAPDHSAQRWLIGFGAAILVAGLALAGLASLNRGLKRMVAAKTAELQAINKTLESDIQARRQAEAALRREQAFTDGVVDGIPGIFFVIDPQGRYVRWNKEHEALVGLGPEGLRNTVPLDRIHPEDRDRVAKTIEQIFTTGAAEVEARGYVGQEGEIRQFFLCGRRFDSEGVAYLIGFGLDITARKAAEAARQQLEEQLRQAQKLESVGRLAGGVAHDFNNLLTVILGYASLLLKQTPERDPRRAAVEYIRDSGMRAAELTGQLLAFSRRQIIAPKPTQLNDEVRRAERLIGRLVPENITVITQLAPSLGLVLVDSGQIQQVLMNLAVNAKDAMPEGGTLLIETANLDLDGHSADEYPGLAPGSYALLAVTDTGIGMEKDVREHIFEPFFTTKASGVGTGLGLAMVYGIVQQSGGRIWVYSELKKGTTFKIYFPQLINQQTERQRPTLEAATSDGTETILVVEDQRDVRSLIHAVLKAHGYRVVQAANGEEALRWCQEHQEPIDLLLTDVVMPGINGKELNDRIQKLRPNTRTLFMSGYSESIIAHNGTLQPGIAFVPKPLTAETLLAKIRDVLAS